MIFTSKTIHINPKKLLKTKWTAVTPCNKEKHFIVIKLIEPNQPTLAIEWVTLEAVHSKRTQMVAWRALTDSTMWLQGWQ